MKKEVFPDGYGHNRANSGAGPSGSQHPPPPAPIEPDLRDNNKSNDGATMELDDYLDDLDDHLDNPNPMDLDLDEDEDNNLDRNMARNLDNILGNDMYDDKYSRAGSNSRSFSHSCSRSRTGSRSSSWSRSRSHTASPCQPCQPRPPLSDRQSSAEPGGGPEFGRIDGAEDAAFYANLFGDDQDIVPPRAFRLDYEPGGRGDNEGDKGGEEEEEEEHDNGEDGEDGGDGEPNPDENQAPGQHEPAIFVPVEFDDNPGDPDDHAAGPLAFAEYPVLRNNYIRTWIQAAFYGATHEAIQAMLESQKLSIQATSTTPNRERALLPCLVA
ncbi:hypothetical protein FRC12_021552 [Ceratobasidium sp. 428]|nr:hypothetical protein FRC12_021552 [Ceratobasidium sp. 428]